MRRGFGARRRAAIVVMVAMVSGTLPAISQVQTAAAATYKDTVLADGPTRYYRLGETHGPTAVDASSSQSNGTYAASGIEYGVGGALVGDSDTAITTASTGAAVTASGSGLPTGYTPRTVEIWEKTTNQTALMDLFSYGTYYYYQDFEVLLNQGNQVKFEYDPNNSGGYMLWTAPYSLADGNWHQIVVTYGGYNANMYAYVDGQQIGSGGFNGGSLNTTAGQLQLGYGGNGVAFQGSLDELSIYGSQLSPSQIDGHYKAGVAAPCPSVPTTGYAGTVASDSPVRYFRLGETSGRAAADYSGNCRSGAYNFAATHVSGALVSDVDGAVGTPSIGTSAVVASSDALPGGYSPRTVEVWEKTTNQTALMDLFSYGNYYYYQDFEVLLNQGNQVKFEFDPSNTNGYLLFNAPYSLADGNWHQIVVSYGGYNANLYAYVDGQQIGSGGFNGGSLNTNLSQQPLELGYGGNGVAFQGSLDELSTYGSQLSASQIDGHYKAGVEATCPAVATTGYGGAIASDSPVRYFRLGETSGRAAADYSGNCRSGAYNFAATHVSGALVSDVDGAVGTPASGKSAVIASSDGLPGGYSPRTVEVWEKTTNQTALMDLFSYGNYYYFQDFELLLNQGNQVKFEYDPNNTNGYMLWTAPYSLADGNWHQIVVTYGGYNSNMYAYVDGQWIGSGGFSGGSLNTNLSQQPLELGYGGNGVAFQGSLDELSVFASQLSSARILAHYHAGAPIGRAWGGSEAFGDHNFCLGCMVRADKFQAHFAKPVNALSGNMEHDFVDISIPGRSQPLAISRTYNSLAASSNGPFGYGWSTNYQMSLSCSGTTATITQENGSTASFTTSGSCTSGSWSPALPRYIATVAHNADGTWTFVRQGRDTFTFNSSGQLTATTDLNGYITSLTYAGGQLSTVTDPAGRSLSLTWSSGRITTVTDANVSPSRSVQYQYNDGNGNLTDVLDLGGIHWRFVYDASHRMTSMLDPNCFAAGATCNGGNGIQTHYDANGRVDWQQDQLGRQTSFDYTSIPNSTKVTDPKGNIKVELYNQGLRVAETRGYGTPQAATWKFAYDPATLASISVQDPNGNRTNTTVDTSGSPLTVTDPMGRQRTRTFNAFSETLTDKDGNNITTTSTYDARGNLTQVSRPLTGTSQVQSTVYNHGDASHPGDVTSMVDADNKTWAYGYDGSGYRNSVTDPLGNQATSSFNAVGWLVSAISPKGNVSGCGCASSYTTSYSYVDATSGRNNFGDVVSVSDPLSHGWTKHYDADRNVDSVKDAKGNLTTYVFDLDNELTQANRADTPQTVVTTDYNPDGTVADQKDGKSNPIATYTYDPIGRVATTADALGNTTSNTYDGAGNLLTRQDPGGICSAIPKVGCTITTYDTDNELTGITYSDGVTPNVSQIVYDNDGQRTAMTDGTGSSNWGWDSLHRLTSYTNGAGAQARWVYNLRNLPTTITYPNGQSVTRTYDDAGRFTAVQDWFGKQTVFTYDPNSNLTNDTYPATGSFQSADAFTFDPANRLMSINEQTLPSTTYASMSYQRDANDQVSNETDTGFSNTKDYTYTTLNQLKGVNASSYAYDAADNLIQTSAGSQQAFNAADQLCWTLPTASANPCATVPAGATTFAYDNRGSRTSTTPPVGSATNLTYDQDNRLSNISRGSTSASYAYNGDGLRMSKTVGPTTSQMTWDLSGGLPLLLTDGTNNYVYGPGGLPVEQVVPTPPAISLVGTGSGGDNGAIPPGSVNITFTAAAQANDQIFVATTELTDNAPATPTGYSLFDTVASSGANPAKTWIFRKTATGGETGVSLSYGGASGKSAVAAIYRNVDPNTPVDVRSSNSTNNGNSVTVPSVTSTSPNAMLVIFEGATNNAPGAWTQPSGMTSRAEKNDGVLTSVAVADQALGAAAATGSRTATLGSAPTLQMTGYLLGLNPLPVAYYLHHDQLGSTRNISDSHGLVVGTNTYDPYGNVAAQTGAITTPVGYAGQYTDSETGLIYLRARYYDPSTGQFISRDPITALTREPYAYVGDNPLNGTDAVGMAPSGYGMGILRNHQEGRADPTMPLPLQILLLGCGGVGAAALGGIGLGALLGGAELATVGGMPVAGSAIAKLDSLANKFGTDEGSLVSSAMSNGSRYVDNANNGNINVLLDRPDGMSGFVRITLDPTGQRIISAGLMQARNVANGVAGGRFTPQ